MTRDPHQHNPMPSPPGPLCGVSTENASEHTPQCVPAVSGEIENGCQRRHQQQDKERYCQHGSARQMGKVHRHGHCTKRSDPRTGIRFADQPPPMQGILENHQSGQHTHHHAREDHHPHAGVGNCLLSDKYALYVMWIPSPIEREKKASPSASSTPLPVSLLKSGYRNNFSPADER